MSQQDNFLYTFELVPARASKGKAIDDILLFAEKAAKGGILSALSITENAGGHPALSPIALGQEIKAANITPIIHFSCKDKNRNLIESQLFELDRHDLRNLLVLTGDYPRYGYKGIPKPVFDVDSVVALEIIKEMREGYNINPNAPGGGVRLQPMVFQAGCVVSPFKRLEAEAMGQYLKLKKKVKNGADYVITQMGYDVRKFQELLFFVEDEGLNVPAYATVFIPSVAIARIMRRGVIPGCLIPERLMHEIEGWGKDRTKRLQFAARLTALLKRLGFNGVHLSGADLCYEDIEAVVQMADDFYKTDLNALTRPFLFPEMWSFYLYEADEKTGLNKRTREQDKDKKIRQESDAHNNKSNYKSRISGISEGVSYRANRLIHKTVFERDGMFYPAIKRLFTALNSMGYGSIITSLEFFIKGPLFECQMCGDCKLYDFAYLCPQSQCAKGLLNGPCGGSRDGWCEVWHKKKRCFYVRVYERLKALRKECLFLKKTIPPRDWEHWKSSSWLREFQGEIENKTDL